MTRSDVSDAISKQIDEQVRAMVKRLYEETVSLVSSHRSLMDQLVERLIELETMDGDEFRALVSETTTIPEKERFSPVLNP
jgi:cell division protease FtsH